MNIEVLNKKNFENIINTAYNHIIDDYITSKLLNDFKLESFCRGYLCCLDTLSSWYNLKISNKVIDKRNKLQYI